MLRIKVSTAEVDQPAAGAGALDSIRIEGFIENRSQDATESEFSKENLNSNFILITEKEFQEKLASKQGRRSNPLMLNFEEYN